MAVCPRIIYVSFSIRLPIFSTARQNLAIPVNEFSKGSVSQIVTMLSNHNLSEDYKENAAEFIRKCASELNGERIKSYIQQASNHLI